MTEPARETDHGEDDAALMLRAGKGDEYAFALLVERHHRMVIGALTRMIGDSHEAHDLAQQTFLRVWKAAPRYQPAAKFTTWLFTIVRNLAFNESRRRSNARLVDVEGTDPGGSLHEPSSGDAAPSDHLQQAELERAISDAIAALPEQQRMALVLRRYEDRSYEEIAVILKTTVPSVKSLLFRARAELKQKLAHWMDQK